MKKFFFSLVFLSISLCVVADQHLAFKGIPITGSLTEFCSKLRTKGFTQIQKDGNTIIFSGTFTGRNANVGVIASDNGNDVYSIIVLFDESDSWNTLVNTYDYYKDLYTEKYGQPTQCVESTPVYADSNTALMLALNDEEVTYASVFELEGGIIQISIEKGTRLGKGFVIIRYQDNQNAELKRQNELEEI